MADHDGALHAQLVQGLVDQAGLCFRGPAGVARTFTVAKARAVKTDHPRRLRSLLDQAAEGKVGGEQSISVQ